MNPLPSNSLLAALHALRAAFDDLCRPAMIIGGLAVIARGVPRQTIDVDATIEADGLDLQSTLEALSRRGFISRIPDPLPFARQRQMLLLRHEPSSVPIDISLAWLPFEREALARASELDFGGIRLPVADVDDLIVLKAVAWRDRDRSDIERLLVRHKQTVNLSRIRGVLAQLFGALEEPDRLTEFDHLVSRALPRD